MSPTPSLAQLRERVQRSLQAAVPRGRLAVAFSGGVDSTLLLALAAEALGAPRVLAVTARSESLARDELTLCRELTARLGVEHRELITRELSREGYRRNAGDRCYHCKTELFERIEQELTAEADLTAVAYGATTDDLGDHRPGMRAATEHAILAPLAEAGLGKAEIRALARELDLPVWDKPAQPCLASRIPYGQEVTAGKLAAVDEAERLLRGLGLRELRVRHHEQPGGPLARIEVPLEDVPRLLEPGVRERVVSGLRQAGFRAVTLDLEGFRSGSLNEALRELGDPARKLPLALTAPAGRDP